MTSPSLSVSARELVPVQNPSPKSLRPKSQIQRRICTLSLCLKNLMAWEALSKAPLIVSRRLSQAPKSRWDSPQCRLLSMSGIDWSNVSQGPIQKSEFTGLSISTMGLVVFIFKVNSNKINRNPKKLETMSFSSLCSQ